VTTTVRTFAIPFTIITLGISHVTTQIAVIREFINVFSGNEIVVGIIIALWLLLSGIGAWLGKLCSSRTGHVAIFHGALIPVALLPPIMLLAIRFLSNRILIGGEVPGMGMLIVGAFVTLTPYCILTGMLLTVGSSILDTPGRKSAALGRVYFLDNIGDVMGGVLFTLILSTFLDNLTVLYIPALLCLGAFLMLTPLRPSGRCFFFLLGTAGIAFVTVLFLAVPLGHRSLTWLYPGQNIVASSESPYGRLVVTRRGDQISFFENGEHLFSTPNTFSNEELVHFALPQLTDTAEVLLVSGGMAGVVDEIMKYPVRHLDYVELDPQILSAGHRHLDRHFPPQVHLHLDDGRTFIRKRHGQYHAVLLDLPDPLSLQLNRFYTVEFFREVRNSLRPRGIICFAVSGAENYISHDQALFLSTLYNSLQAVFTHVMIIPGERHIFLASDGPLTPDVAPLIETRGIRTHYVNEHYLRDRTTEERRSILEERLSDDVPVNLDYHPRAFSHKIRVWLGMFQQDFRLFLIIAAVLFIVYIGRMGIMGKVLFSTGFTASSMEVIILLVYQILSGSIYTGIGLIIASFMSGLAAGSYLANRMHRITRNAIILIEIAMIVYMVIFIIVISSIQTGEGGLSLILPSLLIGALAGAEFPMAGEVSFTSPWDTAGTLYAADLIGGSLGAFVTSIFLIPLVGIYGSCLVLMGMKLVIIVLLITGTRR